MPNFKYKGISLDGAPVSGVIKAYDEFEAIDKIKQSGSIVSSIKEVDESGGNLLNKTIGTPKYNEKALSLMCSQFAIVLKAGMPIVRCVELISQQTADKMLKQVLTQVAEDVATGYSLAQSFENKGKGLPTTFIETIRSGEESGSLEIAFARLEIYFKKSAEVKAKVRSAMMYPIFLSVIAVVVIAVVLLVAMPVFTEMFDETGGTLPVPTQILLNISDFFAKWWFIVLAVIAAIVIGLNVYAKTENGKMNFAKMQLKMPALGHVAKMKGASQFANTMATMMAAGLSVIRATTICAKILDNYYLGHQLEKAAVGLEEGKSLGTCLTNCGCFPELLVEMTAVGEETGSIEDTLDTIGEYYDAEVETATQRALGILQPAIILLMGVIIGFIVIALYMPMFTMYDTI